jgi:hypothetical protein
MFAFDDGPIKVTPSKQNKEHSNPWGPGWSQLVGAGSPPNTNTTMSSNNKVLTSKYIYIYIYIEKIQ